MEVGRQANVVGKTYVSATIPYSGHPHTYKEGMLCNGNGVLLWTRQDPGALCVITTRRYPSISSMRTLLNR